MIWCVEDDASIRDIEVYVLTTTGFEAMGFEDGDSFWQALQSRHLMNTRLLTMTLHQPVKTAIQPSISFEEYRVKEATERLLPATIT